MEQSHEQSIQAIIAKLKELNMSGVSVSQSKVCDLSAYGRAHSLQQENSISVSGELKKSDKQNGEKLNAFIDSTIKPQFQGSQTKFSNTVSCPIAVGDQFETIKDITKLDGTPASIEYKNDVPMIIDFWATWCGPCQGPMKHNQEMLVKNPDWEGKVRIIGVGMDKTADPLKAKAENLQKVEHYHAPTGFQHPTAKAFGIKGIPFLAIYDKKGNLVFTGHPSEAKLDVNIPKLIDGTYEPKKSKGVGSTLGKITDITDMNGDSKEIEVDDKIKLVDFWATWCGPCQKPMQHNIDMMEKNKDKWSKNVRIIGLSCDDTLGPVKQRIEDKKWDSIEQYHLKGGFDHDLPQASEVEGIPHVMLVDRKDTILWKGHPSSIDLEATINDLIDGKEVNFSKPKENGGEVKQTDGIISHITKQNEFLADVEENQKPWVMLTDTVTYNLDDTKSQKLSVMRRKLDAEQNEKAKEFLDKLDKQAKELNIAIRDV